MYIKNKQYCHYINNAQYMYRKLHHTHTAHSSLQLACESVTLFIVPPPCVCPNVHTPPK